MLPKPSLIPLFPLSSIYSALASPIRLIFTGYFDCPLSPLSLLSGQTTVFYLNYCNFSLALPLAPPIHSPQDIRVILKQKQDHVTPLPILYWHRIIFRRPALFGPFMTFASVSSHLIFLSTFHLPVTSTILRFLKCSIFFPASGPLHLLSPLSGKIFSQLFA